MSKEENGKEQTKTHTQRKQKAIPKQQREQDMIIDGVNQDIISATLNFQGRQSIMKIRSHNWKRNCCSTVKND